MSRAPRRAPRLPTNLDARRSRAQMGVAYDFLTPEQVGDWLGVAPATLSQWRYRGIGPTFVKVGRLVRYRTGEVVAWIDMQQRDHNERREHTVPRLRHTRAGKVQVRWTAGDTTRRRTFTSVDEAATF